jgi:hypothetical protein
MLEDIKLIELCYFIIKICLSLYIALLLATISIKIYNIRKNKIINKLKHDYQVIVLEFLFSSKEIKETIERLRINNRLKRKILIDVLFGISNNLKGSYLDKLNILYKNLELNKNLEARIYSAHKSKNLIEIINEISIFKLNEFEDYIIELTRHKNMIVKQNAKLALFNINEGKFNKYVKTKDFNKYENLYMKELTDKK